MISGLASGVRSQIWRVGNPKCFLRTHPWAGSRAGRPGWAEPHGAWNSGILCFPCVLRHCESTQWPAVGDADVFIPANVFLLLGSARSQLAPGSGRQTGNQPGIKVACPYSTFGWPCRHARMSGRCNLANWQYARGLDPWTGGGSMPRTTG